MLIGLCVNLELELEKKTEIRHTTRKQDNACGFKKWHLKLSQYKVRGCTGLSEIPNNTFQGSSCPILSLEEDAFSCSKFQHLQNSIYCCI